MAINVGTMRNERKRRRTTTRLSHLDAHGRARMVDVGSKPVTEREAIAEATLRMRPETLRLIRSGKIAKGEVLAVARVAGIMAAKRVSEIIPLCHPLPIEVAAVNFEPDPRGQLRIEARVKVNGKTGVEMEALVAASVAALTVYDMCKAVDRGMEITNVRLLQKRGGRSGTWSLRDGSMESPTR